MTALLQRDYDEFLKLKISREVVDRAGIFRVDREEAELRYGIKLDCDGGICFPYFLPPSGGNDTKHAVAYSVRQDSPKYDSAGKAARKYVATAGRQHPYLAPVANPEWFQDPSVPIILCEAQKSALAILCWAEDHGRRFIPVSIAGCYGWRGATGTAGDENGERVPQRGLLPGLAATCQGHRVYILLDQNAATNPHVQHGRAWLAETLLNDSVTDDVRVLSLPPSITAPHWNGPDDFISIAGDEAFAEVFETAKRFEPSSVGGAPLGSCSTAELFAAQEKHIDWLCWPFAAVGLASILDALPKLGKTVFLLHGIHASRERRPFLNFATKPMRVCYVSEQSRASLAMQAREIGFTGDEPLEELRWITREDWSRHVYTDFLMKLEKEIIEPGQYNSLVIDTFHTVSRMEDEKDASEVNRLGNLTIDVATRNNLALALGRHDRKSGGDIGVSGRSSIQLSGLVDVILHLIRVANQPTQRKLELLGRVPGLPNAQLIDLVNGVYMNWGEPETLNDKTAQVGKWLEEEPTLTGEQIVARFADEIPPVEVSLATANRYKADAKQNRKKKP